MIEMELSFDQAFEAALKVDPNRFNEIAGNILERKMRRAVQAIHGEVLPLTPFATGNLRKSEQFHAQQEIVGEVVEVTGEVTAIASYSYFVEAGTRAHWVPLYPLYLWALRKFGVEPGMAWGIAKKVQKKIAAVGTLGQTYMKSGWAVAKAEVEQEMEEAFEEIARETYARYLNG